MGFARSAAALAAVALLGAGAASNAEGEAFLKANADEEGVVV